MRNLQNEHIELLSRYFEGIASPEEIAQVEIWIQEENQAFLDYQKIWEKSSFPTFDTDKGWSKVSQQINHETQTNIEIDKKETKIFTLNWAMKIAAVLIFVIGLGVLFIPQEKTQEFSAKEGQDSLNVELSDGSKATLAAHSHLIYSKNDSVRTCKLDGKAFFNIQRDTTTPFVIETQETGIRVLGTSFHVNSQKDDSIISVDVVSGKVKFYSLTTSESVILTKGQKALFNKKTLTIISLTADNRPIKPQPKRFSWKRTKLADVCSEIGDIFETKFEFESYDLKMKTVTSGFTNKGLDDVLQRLSTSLNVSFEKNEKGYFVKSN